MKIYFSNYRYHWLSPYTIMEKLLFWKRWTDPEFDLYDDKNDHYADWLVRPLQLCTKILDFVHPEIRYVKIDRYDTWDMDSTLALIILPMLRQLQATKHGAPNVDDKDVPKELRSTNAGPKENEWDTDDLWFKRWDWVLEQMIWSFEQLQPDCDWQSQFHTGVSDVKFVKLEDGSGLGEMVRGPNDTSKWDRKGHTAYQKRISNGLVLFGKYYQGLWD